MGAVPGRVFRYRHVSHGDARQMSMRVYDMEQGTPEWFKVRGLQPTGSAINKAVTMAGALSKQADKYILSLLATQIATGPIEEGFKSDAMARGTLMEEEARLRFELETGLDVQQVGFCVREDGLAGCSPDGLIADSEGRYYAGLEIKCPLAATHIGYLMEKKVPTTYVPQVQCMMWVCDLTEAWFMSYHPVLPHLLVYVPRDDEYINRMTGGLLVFKEAMREQRVLLDKALEGRQVG